MALHAFQGPVRSWVSGRYRAMAAFGRALDVCLEEYVEPRPADELVHGAIEGMVEGLHDRHSAFLPPVAHRRLQESETDHYAGLGIGIDLTRDQKLLISKVFDASPAAEAGLRPGDVILWALEHDPDGLRESTKHDFATVTNVHATSNVLRGEKGSKVTLHIRRPKPRGLKETPAKAAEKEFEELDITLVRGEVTRPVIETRLLDGGIGYLRLGDFPDGAAAKVAEGLDGLRYERLRGRLIDLYLRIVGGLRDYPAGKVDETIEELEKAAAQGPFIERFRNVIEGLPGAARTEAREGMAKLGAEGIRALILDLRNNDGGFLDEAIRIADLFIADGVVLSTQNRCSDENRVFHATRGGPAEELPMAVLVDARSASAAEVLAGTLQDHGRAKLVGAKTYGKGAVSKRFPLGDGSGILLSTGRYILPKGGSIEGTGLEPDLAVPYLTREERDKLNLEPGVKPPDPQLDAAAKLLRERLGGAPPEPK